MDLEKLKTNFEMLMGEFDFEKVDSIMNHLNWKWGIKGGDYRIPTVEEMKETCRNLFNDLLVNNKHYDTVVPSSSGGGGFEVEVCGNSVSIRFIVESIWMEMEDENE